MSWAARVMASWAVKKRVAALAIVYLLDGRAGVLVLGEPVGRVLDDEEGDGARVRVWRDSSLVVGRWLKSGLGAVEGGGRHLVRCGLELRGSWRVDGGGERVGWGC